MNYRGIPSFDHGQASRIGVLLTNLGTPDAPTPQALRPYLKEFLSDPRVVEFPRLLWWLILNGIILNTRPRRSAKAYETVWTERGSPLLYHLEDQVAGVSEQLRAAYGDAILVRGAMRYGNPSIPDVLAEMLDAGVEKLVVLPLYPHYSGPTTGSTFDKLSETLCKQRRVPDLRWIASYHDHPDYIAAITNSIRSHRARHGDADKLVFSYHGMPERYLQNGDPYHCQCHKTTRLVAEALELSQDQYMTTFQSRFGREEWLKPYTDETLGGLPEKGVQSLQVICPGFSADCLETIEEIGEENRDIFLEAGGERYEYIPCLNAQPDHVALLADLIAAELKDWTTTGRDSEQTHRLARALGADQ